MRTKKTILISGMSRTERGSLAILLPNKIRDTELAFLTDTKQHKTSPPDAILLSAKKTTGPAHIKTLKNHYPHSPIICISSAPCPDADIVLSPPVDVDTLATHLESILKTPVLAPKTKKKSRFINNKARTRIATFDISNKILGGLVDAHKKLTETGLAVEFQAKTLISYLLLPDGQVFATTCKRTLKSLCRVSFDARFFKTRVIPPDELEHIMTDRYKNSEKWLLEDFLCHVGYWSSHGRLPATIDKHRPLHIKKWPNAPQTPNPLLAVSIAALLRKRPTSISGIIRKLNIPAETAARCITGMYAAGVLTQSTDGTIEKMPFSQSSAKPATGILKKLVRRLLAPWHHHTTTLAP